MKPACYISLVTKIWMSNAFKKYKSLQNLIFIMKAQWDF
jgi:hypothetical protein